MKITIQKNHLGALILYGSLNSTKKRRFHNVDIDVDIIFKYTGRNILGIFTDSMCLFFTTVPNFLVPKIRYKFTTLVI